MTIAMSNSIACRKKFDVLKRVILGGCTALTAINGLNRQFLPNVTLQDLDLDLLWRYGSEIITETPRKSPTYSYLIILRKGQFTLQPIGTVHTVVNQSWEQLLWKVMLLRHTVVCYFFCRKVTYKVLKESKWINCNLYKNISDLKNLKVFTFDNVNVNR